MSCLPLCERLRPHSLDEVIGQEKIVSILRRLHSADALAGKAYWISGPSGTGKTSLARIIANLTAEEWCIDEFTDPSELTAQKIERIRHLIQARVFGKGCCFILNEAHGLTNGQIRKLLGLIETIPTWITWVFTTTKKGQEELFDDAIDAHPFLSRCILLPLTNQALCPLFSTKAKQEAEALGLDGKDIKQYERLVADNKNNLRAVYQAIEAGAMLKGT